MTREKADSSDKISERVEIEQRNKTMRAKRMRDKMKLTTSTTLTLHMTTRWMMSKTKI
jgi:hypothetical protein